MKKSFGSLILVALVTVFFVSPALAMEGAEKWCGEKMERNGHKENKLEIGKKIEHKAQILLWNKKELGLSEEQIKAIHSLVLDVKKNEIKNHAEGEIFAIDIMTKLKEQPIDLEAVNKLIDQKYEMKKTQIKSLAASYAKLKSVLTEDQIKILKTLWEPPAPRKERREHKQKQKP